MKLIILAAGKGTRLKSDKHKCLTKVENETLLERHINIANQTDINEIILVIGYKSKEVIEYVKSLENNKKLTIIENVRFEESGSCFSLYMALKYLKNKKINDNVFFLDADVYYDYNIVKDFIKNSSGNNTLVGYCKKDDIEAVKVYKNKKNKTVSIGKKFSEEGEFFGEAIGIIRLAKGKVNRFLSFFKSVKNPMLEWETFLDSMINNVECKFDLKVTYAFNNTWKEIDTQEDLKDTINMLNIVKSSKLDCLFLGVDGLEYEFIMKNIQHFPNFKSMMNLGSYGTIDFSDDSNRCWGLIYSGGEVDKKSLDALKKQRGLFDNEGTCEHLKFNKTGWWSLKNENFIWNKLSQASKKSCWIDGYLIRYIPDDYFIGDNSLTGKFVRDKIFLRNPGKYSRNYEFPIKKLTTSFFPGWLDRPQKKIDEITIEEIDNGLDAYMKLDVIGIFSQMLEDELKAFKWILRNKGPLDFFHYYIGILDYIGHLVYFCPERYLQCYKEFDRILGKYISDIDFKRIAVLSDHGMASIDRIREIKKERGHKNPYSGTKVSQKYGTRIERGQQGWFIISGEHLPPNSMFFMGEGIKSNFKLNTIPEDYKKIYSTLLKMGEIDTKLEILPIFS